MLKNKHHPQTNVTHCQQYKYLEEISKINNSATKFNTIKKTFKLSLRTAYLYIFIES